MIKAFIFDVDGVLVDSEYQNFISLRDALQQVLDFEIPAQIDATLGPIPTFKKIEHLRKEFNLNISEEDHAKIMKLKFSLLLKELADATFNAHVPKIFEYIKTKNAKIALVSNARTGYIEYVIDRLGVKTSVDYFVGSNLSFKPKPDPDMYLHAMQILGVKPDQAIIFEDSEIGLAAATATGARTVKIESVSHLTLDLVKEINESSYHS